MKPKSLGDPLRRQARRKEVDIVPVPADQIDEASVIDRIAIGAYHGRFREEDLVGERYSPDRRGRSGQGDELGVKRRDVVGEPSKRPFGIAALTLRQFLPD